MRARVTHSYGARMVRMRLEPQDDYLHAVETASNFNESRYYNFFDPKAGMGGWVRMGNRPNEGYAEMTVCLYLPDGRVAFNFKRPRIENHDAHDAGGLRFEVIAPYEEHRITYDGKVCVLARPREMADPKTAFHENPHMPCTIDLTLRRVGRPWGGEPEWEEGEAKPDLDPEKMFARGHTEQHMAITGTVQVGDETVRDHRRARSARPLVGSALLAERLVVPLADGQPRPEARLRAHDLRQRRGSGRATCRRIPVRRRPLRRRPLGHDPRLANSRRRMTTNGSRSRTTQR